tara:strand:+ start:3832 stop:4032 length:201 start_codon:yes stop_codon:yes gene_type:complete
MFKHLKENEISYLGHFLFAMGISWRLSISSLIFMIHALLPVISIPDRYNLDAMALFLFEKNNELDK